MTGRSILLSSCALLLLLAADAVIASEGPAEKAVATISGRIAGCPSDWFPPMYVYARNWDPGALSLSIPEGHSIPGRIWSTP
jgi:hypothetical protein